MVVVVVVEGVEVGNCSMSENTKLEDGLPTGRASSGLKFSRSCTELSGR